MFDDQMWKYMLSEKKGEQFYLWLGPRHILQYEKRT